MLHDLVSQMEPETLKVHVPNRAVFLCGGAIDGNDPPEAPKMLRDAYFRTRKDHLEKLPFKIILAEDADPLTTEAGYGDLLSFESDIAQVVGLIVLFVESAGSFAELGAFAALPTIAPSLLAVILDHYYDQKSFIKHGPIKYLEDKYGESSVLSLDTALLSIVQPSDISPVKQLELTESLESTIKFRLDELKKWRSVDLSSDGHKILVITGLCQEYGALTQGELKELLEKIGINIDTFRLKNFLYCAELLKWIKVIRKGHNKYIAALTSDGQERALDWKFKEGTPYKDRLRWRAIIREYWRAHDNLRHRAIVEAGSVHG